jgi:putative peptide zinc metalloprotease protein
VLAATAAWWPHGQYRPIQADEALTVPNAVQDVVGLGAGGPTPASLASVRAPVPEAHPARWSAIPPAAPTLPVPPADRARFRPPAPPGPDDNQALAISYTDGTTVFDVALSLIWATGAEVTSTNQAYALASCRDCKALAVAFQVVLILDDAKVVAPDNQAVAVNALCDGCVTQALAMQLVLTLNGAPDAATRQRLDAIWARLAVLTQHLDTASFEQTAQALADVKAEIVTLLRPFTAIAAAADDIADGTAAVADTVGLSPLSTPSNTTTPDASVTSTTSPAPEASTSTSATAPEGTTTSTTAPDGAATSTTTPDGSTTSTTAPPQSTTTTTPDSTTTTAPASG